MRLLALLILLSLAPGCVVSQRCFKKKDCPAGQTCNAEGRCEPGAVLPDLATDGQTPIRCLLPDMVPVANAFCIDIYEASRPDATKDDPGTDESKASNREGVLPWMLLTTGTAENEEAAQACKAAGKRLCTPLEWQRACQGPDSTVYSYGDGYEKTTCNGIDAFGDPGQGLFKLMPTGSFPRCVNEWGVLDINGNLWEHVAGGSTKTVRGGAFNCGDSATLHRCDYIPGWTPSARGFRCCADGVPVTVDAGPTLDLPPSPDRGPDLPPLDLLDLGTVDALPVDGPHE
jgi:hypothetical protein